MDHIPFRQEFILERLKTTRIPTRHIFFDAETMPVTSPTALNCIHHNFRLACATFVEFRKGRPPKRTHIATKSKTDFWAWVASNLHKRNPTWLWAHNLGFDLTTLCFWGLAERQVYTIDFACLEDPPTILSTKCGVKRAKFVDTLNFWQCPLSELGESVGLPKMPLPAFTDPNEDWIEYCRNDVSIIERAVTSLMELVRKEEMGTLRFTVSSQAMSAFRRKHMSHDIHIHGNSDAIKLERDAYYGGRCSCFLHGRVGTVPPDLPIFDVGNTEKHIPVEAGPVYHLDITSLYPSVMQFNQFPVKLVNLEASPGIAGLKEWFSIGGAVARVELNAQYFEYPERQGIDVIYRKGRFVTTLAGPELQRALEYREVKSIGLCAYYEVAPIFTDFVNNFWALRLLAKDRGDKVAERLYKDILNGLYGKFGQKNCRWDDEPLLDSPCPWGVFYCDPGTGKLAKCYRSIAWLAQAKTCEEENATSFPAIAAYVTSYGRCRMDGLRTIAGDRNVFYQDTDSIHTNDNGLRRLANSGSVHDGRLGCLRLLERSDTAVYRGVKDYTIGNRRCIAGISQDAVEIAAGKYSQEEWDRLQSVLSHRPTEYVTVRTVEKLFANRPQFGKVGVDGWLITG